LLEEVSTAERCFNILSHCVVGEEGGRRRHFITSEQLASVVEDILHSHPGLDFLRDQFFLDLFYVNSGIIFLLINVRYLIF
jgi:hypothetical protein